MHAALQHPTALQDLVAAQAAAQHAHQGDSRGQHKSSRRVELGILCTTGSTVISGICCSWARVPPSSGADNVS